MEKTSALKALHEKIERENLPLMEANLVFGEGNPDCKVMFIGEAPGQTEDQLKRPFVGRAGKLLTKLIEEIGWRREDVYITNIVKRRPPENRDPTPEEIESYKPFLTEQINIINPPLIAPLGRFSMNYFLPEVKISNAHGKIFKVDGRVIFPLYHPAAALRATKVLEDLRADFKKLPEMLLEPEKIVERVSLGAKKPNSPQSSLF